MFIKIESLNMKYTVGFSTMLKNILSFYFQAYAFQQVFVN